VGVLSCGDRYAYVVLAPGSTPWTARPKNHLRPRYGWCSPSSVTKPGAGAGKDHADGIPVSDDYSQGIPVSSWTKARSELANEIQHHGPESPRIPGLRGELKTARAEEYLRRILTDPPPLTAEQLARLSGVLAHAAEIVAEMDAPEQGAA
jgi:hypothetical protein